MAQHTLPVCLQKQWKPEGVLTPSSRNTANSCTESSRIQVLWQDGDPWQGYTSRVPIFVTLPHSEFLLEHYVALPQGWESRPASQGSPAQPGPGAWEAAQLGAVSKL